MEKKYDAILCIDPIDMVCEVDDRMVARGKPQPTTGFSKYYNADDPKLYSYFTFGNALRQTLNNMGAGFMAKVTDFKKWVVVEVSYHNTITGKTSSKTFLIVFKQKGDGMVLTTHNRYRTISGVDQAASYIRSACGSLQSDAQNRIG